MRRDDRPIMADADESELSFVLDEFFFVSLRRNVALIKQVIIVVTLVLTKVKIRLKISKITKIAIQQENVNVLYKLCVKRLLSLVRKVFKRKPIVG